MKDYRWSRVTKPAAAAILSVILMLSGCGGQDLTDAQYVQRAKEARDQGDVKNSIIELKNALQQNPENPEARLLLGLNYVEMGDGASAEKELRHAQNLGVAAEGVAVPMAKALLLQGKQDELLQDFVVLPDMTDRAKAELYSLRGRAYLIQGKLEQAGTEFQSALDAKADSTAAMVGQALFAIASQQLDTARSWAAKALEVEPTSAEAWGLMGDLERAAGEPAKAEAAYTKAIDNRLNNARDRFNRIFVRIELERYEDAEKDLRVVKKIAPRHPTVLYAGGLIHYQQQRFAEAQAAFEQTLRSHPNHTLATYYLGLSHYQQDHRQQAEQYLSEFLNEFPQARQVARLLARVRMRNRDLEGAENVLRPLLESNPDDPIAVRLMGNLYLAQGNSNEGIQYLQKAVYLQPDSAETRMQLARGLLQQGEKDQGFKELETAIEMAPELQQAELILINTYLRDGEFDKAVEAASQLTKKQPDDPVPYNLLGVAYMLQDEDEQARQEFEQALTRDPDFKIAAMNLAKLDYKEGNKEAAARRFRQILEQDEGHLGAMVLLADLADQAGHSDEATDWVEKAWEKNPDSPETGVALVQRYLDRDEPLQALNVAQNLHSLYRNHPRVLRIYALALMANGETAGAVLNFRRLTELQPQSAESWHLLATAQTRSKDYRAAAESLDKALDVQGDYLPSLIGKIELQLREGRLDEALAGARAFQAQLPSHSMGYKLEGDVYTRQKEFAKAVAAYQAAYEKSPSRELVLRLSHAQRLAGDNEAALDSLQAWREAHPQDTQFTTQLGGQLQLIALAYLQQKDPVRALEVALQLQEILPDSPHGFSLAGGAYALKGEAADAKAAFNKALEISPGDVNALSNLANYAVFEGDRDEARRLYEAALAHHPSHLNTLLKLAELESQAERPEPARARLEEAVEAHPDALQPGVLLAKNYLAAGEPRKALALTEPLLPRYPNEPALLEVAGRAALRSGDAAAAERSFERLVQALPDSAAARFSYAQSLAQIGELDRARQELARALELDPSYLPARIGEIRMLAQLDGDREGANEALAKVQQEFGDRSEVLDIGVWLALLSNDYATAAEHLSRGLEKTPTQEAALLLVRTLGAQGKHDQALAVMQDWLEDHPQDLAVLLHLAGSYLTLGKEDEARATYAKLQELYPNPVATLMAERPADRETLNLLMQTESRLGQEENAIAMLEQALETNPNDAALRALLAQRYYNAGRTSDLLALTRFVSDEQVKEQPVLLELRAKAALLSGDVASADRSYERLMKAIPDSAEVRFSYAESLAQAGELDRARQELTRALLVDRSYLPARIGEIKMLAQLDNDRERANETLAKVKQEFGDRSEVLGIEGWLALLNNDYETAAERLSQAVEKGPDRDLTLLLVRALWAQEKHDQALEVMQEWLKGQPKDLAVLLHLAGGYLTLERKDEARAVYARVVASYPNHVPALNNLAWLTQDHDLEKAIVYAEYAYELLPNDPQIADTLGTLLLKRGEVSRGYELIREAAEQAPENAEIQLHLGRALAQQKKFSEAQQVLSALIAQTPESPFSEEARALLESLPEN